MTTLIFDLHDVSHASSKYDSIDVRAPKIRAARTRPGVVTDRWVTVRAPGGVEQIDVEPGPMEVRFGSGSAAPVFRVVVPDVDEVYLGDLLGQDEFVEPTVVDRLWAAIRNGGGSGAQGEKGEPGPQGARGEQGERGERGPQGDPADTAKLDYLLDAVNALARRVGAAPFEWPTSEDPATAPEPQEPEANEEPEVHEERIVIESGRHLQNLLYWHFLRERGAVEGEYTATNHDAWIRKVRNIVPSGQFTAAGADIKAMTQLPFHIDTSNVTHTDFMFYGCQSLTSVPEMDTSNVTDMTSMFYGCQSLTQVPAMDTSNVTDMTFMFYGCQSLTSVPEMDTSNVTNMTSMFEGCSSLTDGNVRLIRKDGTKPRIRTNMIRGSRLTREPFFDANGNPI